MKKFFMNLLLCLATVLCLMGFASCDIGTSGGAGGNNGTYYLYRNGDYVKSSFFKLEGDTWTDDDGETGTFTISNGEITFYYTEFGETFDLCDGTISNGVLFVMGDYYCKEGKTPSNGGDSGDSGSSENTAVQFTVTYNANGGAFENGETTITETVDANAVLTAPEAPQKANYTFDGWATSAFGTEKWNFATDQVTKDVTLYAVWTQQSAAILSVDGASIKGQEIFILVNKNTDSVSLSNKVVCSDNSFWKLYYDKLGQMEIPTKIAASTNGSLLNGDNVFYVVVTSKDGTQTNLYELNVHRSYAVSVNYYDGETLLKTDTAYTGYEYTADYTPNITGYTFNDWDYTKRVLWDNLNLYVDKTANTYTVAYDVNGGDELTTTEKTITYDSNYTLVKPTRTGYTFLGWYVDDTQMTNEKGESLTPWQDTNNVTVRALWQANVYTVTLVRSLEEGGSVSGDGEHAYDSNVTITAATYIGYTWLGWYDKDDKLVAMEFSHTFQMGFDVEYTAKWMNCPVTLERNMSEAGSVTGVSRTVLGTQTTITATTNEGYTWLGWYNGETLLTDELNYTFEMSTTNVTYTAKWAYYTATTNTDLSVAGTYTKLTDEKIAVGTETTLAATTYSGYTWLGWYNGETLLTDEMSYTFKMPVENVTYTARWEMRDEMKNFNFTSNATTCRITGIKDKTVTEIVVPDYVTHIHEGAFSGCGNLKSITLPFVGGSIKSDDTHQYAFGYIFGRTTYTGGTRTEQYYYRLYTDGWGYGDTYYYIPTFLGKVMVTGGDIHYGAFRNCRNLNITIGSDVKTIVATAFRECVNLSVTADESNTMYSSENGILYNKEKTELILATLSVVGEVIIPDSVTSIGKYAFYDCSSLTSVVIPDSVTSIGDSAFYYCMGLTNVIIPDSVTSIGKYAFYVCRMMRIEIPDSVAYIGDYAFSQGEISTLIYCEALSKPDGWSRDWNRKYDTTTNHHTVYWGYKMED